MRAIVLTGAGRAFCAGMAMEDSYFPAAPKPAISAINGATAGLGLVMALCSDFRIASNKAVFPTAFARRGLIA